SRSASSPAGVPSERSRTIRYPSCFASSSAFLPSCPSSIFSLTCAVPFLAPSAAFSAACFTLSRKLTSILLSVRAAAEQAPQRARRPLRGGLAAGVDQGPGQRHHVDGLQDDLPVALQCGQRHPLAAEERCLHPLRVELPDALHAVGDAVLEGHHAARV